MRSGRLTKNLLEPCLQGIGAPLVSRKPLQIKRLVPDPLPGSRIGSQNRVCHTGRALSSYPRPRGPPSFSARNQSIRYVHKGSGRKNSYLACSSPSVHLDSLTHYYLSVIRMSFFNQTGSEHLWPVIPGYESKVFNLYLRAPWEFEAHIHRG